MLLALLLSPVAPFSGHAGSGGAANWSPHDGCEPNTEQAPYQHAGEGPACVRG
jgi:hypothetical protein